MKIVDLEVDRFGTWQKLKLNQLSGQITVFYGANEAGKTTLLQFVRAVLYGFASPRRRRYLPSDGEAAGGTLSVTSPHGEFLLARRCQGLDASGDHLEILGADGALQGAHWLQVLLADVDESIYNNVFAVGLRELQELGTLGDTQAAAWLYRLTSGLDRVSLVDVMTELEVSRTRILAADDRPCRVSQLLAERQRLQGEVAELEGLTGRWQRLGGQRRELDQQIARIEIDTAQGERSLRVLEVAQAIDEQWYQRAALEQQLQQLPAQSHLPDGALQQFEQLTARWAKRRKRRGRLQAQRETIRRQAGELPLNENLWRQGPRIEALGEQQAWIASLESQVVELESQVEQLKAQWDLQRTQAGFSHDSAGWDAGGISRGAVARLRPLARTLRAAQQRLQAAEEERTRGEQNLATLESELSTGMAATGGKDLSEALEHAGNRVAQLRRRLELEERLDQLQRHRADLQKQSVESIDRQLMPVWVVAGLGGAFIFGVVLIFAQFVLPGSLIGNLGWAMAVLGLCGSGGAGLAKFMMERSATNRLDTSHRQLELVERQLDGAKQERRTLDQELPKGGGPLPVRLQTAERELAALEDLLPLEARRQTAGQQVAAARQRAERCHEEVKNAKRGWRDALSAAGLPVHLTPRQIKHLTGRQSQITELAGQLAQRTTELEQRRRELTTLAARIDQFMADAGLPPEGRSLVEKVRDLQAELQKQQARMDRRTVLRRQSRKFKKQELREARAIARLRRRRAALLTQAGVESEEQYRQLALHCAHVKNLRRQHDQLSQQIAAALGTEANEEALAECFQAERAAPPELRCERLGQRRDELARRLEEGRSQLARLIEQRGELRQQQRSLAEDRRLDERRLDLGVVERRLTEALRTWQVRAVTSLMLQSLCEEFEKHRQPETLVEASGYLTRLTDGRYVRVWTPLGEEALYVDDAQGHAWAVDLLSRGTREQLFLSLRLALAALYARRGAELPLVLDDVLVNFDSRRAKAAAAVLRDFAKAGHQLLVFTCHEHVWKMFKTMKVDARLLPDRSEPQPISAPQEETKVGSNRKPKPAVVEVPEPEEDDIELEPAEVQNAILAVEEDEEDDWEEADDEVVAEDEEAGDEEEEEGEEEGEEEWEEDSDAEEEEEYDEDEEEEYDEAALDDDYEPASEDDADEDEVEEEADDEEFDDVEIDEDESDEEIEEADLFGDEQYEEQNAEQPRGARGWEVEFEGELDDQSEAA